MAAGMGLVRVIDEPPPFPVPGWCRVALKVADGERTWFLYRDLGHGCETGAARREADVTAETWAEAIRAVGPPESLTHGGQ